MTDTFDLLNGLSPGDGVRFGLAGTHLANPKAVVESQCEGERLTLTLRGPRGGEYLLRVERDDRRPWMEFVHPEEGPKRRGRVTDLLVVPEAYMPERHGFEVEQTDEHLAA